MENLQFTQFSPESHLHLIDPLTELLHSAYADLAKQGLHYVASHQKPEVTLQRLNRGESYLAFLGDEVIGTVTLQGPKTESASAWYKSAGVYSFHQFAISPQLQGRGIGSKMMDLLESRARVLGATELALDTSEKAHQLINMYRGRGYRYIEHVQWDSVNYRSVILSKSL